MRKPEIPWARYASWAFAAVLLGFLIIRSDGYGWDFKVYCLRARLFFQEGLDPHVGGTIWPYTYPPITLHLFRLFYWLSVPAATRLWILLKMAAFAWMFRLWDRHFVALRLGDPFTVLFLALAFNGAIFYDIASGNIAGFQQWILWLGFAALLQKRFGWYSLAVILIAQVKIDMLFFAAVLLVVEKRPLWKYFFITLAAFTAVYSINAVIYPDVFKNYIHLLLTMATYAHGVNSPSVLAMIRDFIPSTGTWYRPIHLPDISVPLYAAWVLFVLGMSFRAYKICQKGSVHGDPKTLILFVCVIFGLINPRVPPYLYPLFVPAAFFILQQAPEMFPYPFAAALIMWPRLDSSFPAPFARTFAVVEPYTQVFGLIIIWVMYYRYLSRPRSVQANAELH